MGTSELVLGIGRVSIPVKRSPNLFGYKNRGTLELENVLYVPTYYCNVLGTPILRDGYKVNTNGAKSNGSLRDAKGRNAAFFAKSLPMHTLEMRGPPSGPVLKQSVFKKPGQHGILVLGCLWPEDEMKKWEEFKKGKANPVAEDRSSYELDCAHDYTPEEREFLKKHFKNEYKFLQQYGLSIYKEDHREEGRRILRAFMAESSGNYSIL